MARAGGITIHAGTGGAYIAGGGKGRERERASWEEERAALGGGAEEPTGSMRERRKEVTAG